MRRGLGDERGQASVEFLGMVFWLLLAAVFCWQLFLGAWTVNQATNSARTASRVAARADADPEKAARNAISAPLRSGFHKFHFDGETAKVNLKVPIIFPGVTIEEFAVTRKATLPN